MPFDWIRLVRPRNLLVVLVVAAASTFMAISMGSRLPVRYEARAVLLVGSGDNTSDSLQVSQLLTSTYATLATTRPVLAAVVSDLSLPLTVDELRDEVAAVPSRESSTVTIVVRSADAADAARIANAVAAEVVDAVPSDTRITAAQRLLLDDLAAVGTEIGTVVDAIAAVEALPSPGPADLTRLDSLRDRLATLQVTRATLLGQARQPQPQSIRTVDPAVPPTVAVSPNLVLDGLVGLAAGLLLGAAIVLVLEWARGSGLRLDGQLPLARSGG